MPDPTVSVILAVLDEAAHIDDVLFTLANQDYPAIVEIVVADGGSSDGTRDLLDAWSSRDGRIRVIDNPHRRQSPGLNAAAEAATGRYLIRADGHTEYAGDYVSRSIAVAEETGGAAGGPMNPVGLDSFERAVAAVMKTRWLMPARFHHATMRQEVDTVYLGAFRRNEFLAVGGFRAFPSGAGEDPDFYFRWRASGRKVYVDPAIRSQYRPRSTLRGLAKQYFRYGMAKAEMAWVNGRLPSWRPLAPIALVLGLGIAGLAAVAGSPVALGAILAGWLLFLFAVAFGRRSGPLFVVVAATMQLTYGAGAIVGFLSPWRLRDLRSRPERA